MTVNVDLSGICNQYASVGFYEGIVELCLATAANQDNQNLALHLTHTGRGRALKSAQWMGQGPVITYK